MVRIYFLAGLILLLSAFVYGQYSGGAGTAADPFLISDANELNTIGTMPSDWDKHFKLVADIDLSVFTGDSFNLIGNYQTKEPFTGTFDGNNHTITNFTYVASARRFGVGLFAFLNGSSKIQNLVLSNFHVYSTGNYIGGLVGYSSGDILRCSCEGLVSGGPVSSSIGALVGYQYGGKIDQCFSKGTVAGGDMSNYVGGLVGNQYAGNITNSYNVCSVSSGIESYAVGGLIGYQFGSVYSCYNAGSVIGGTYIGGLIGYGAGALNSYWDIQTSGFTESSGGKGRTTAEMKQASTYFGWNNDPNIWTIDDGNDYPRLAWEKKQGIFIHSYSLSDFVAGTGDPNDPYQINSADNLDRMGLFPEEWDKSFILTQNIDLSAYTGAEFDRIGFGGYPFTGVFDGKDFTIRNLSYTATYEYFVGLFGYISDAVIKNLKMENVQITSSGSDMGGLVGYQLGGEIKNCSVNGTVTGGEQCNSLGGLVGYQFSGNIVQCSSSCTVSGGELSTTLGGLAGGRYSGTIDQCYSLGNVFGASNSDYIGGFVGYQSSGLISNSYSHGSVAGNQYIGGFIGYHFTGEIKNVYSKGYVSGSLNTGGLVGYKGVSGVVTKSFWDAQTSGKSTSSGGLGYNTVQMKRLNTFVSNGWDFVNETANGTKDIWKICDTTNYPRLAWQAKLIADFTCPDGVGQEDLVLIMSWWLAQNCQTGSECGVVDLVKDGKIDLEDFTIFASYWLLN